MRRGLSLFCESPCRVRLRIPDCKNAEADLRVCGEAKGRKQLKTQGIVVDEDTWPARSDFIKSLDHLDPFPIDRINRTRGRGTVRYAGEGLGEHWRMRQGRLSESSTTEWGRLPAVR